MVTYHLGIVGKDEQLSEAPRYSPHYRKPVRNEKTDNETHAQK